MSPRAAVQGMRAGDRGMRGVRPEPAEVWTQDGRPTRFGWRGRLYTVLAVLERPEGAAGRAEPDAGNGERERVACDRWRCWRVSASPGVNIPADIYRLCQDALTGRWMLSRDSG